LVKHCHLAAGTLAAAFAFTGTGFPAPAITQQNKDRIIFAMSQEPVQFNVQRRDRLVGNHQARTQRERAGDTDALSLAGRSFV
jgi:hypothetical protein